MSHALPLEAGLRPRESLGTIHFDSSNAPTFPKPGKPTRAVSCPPQANTLLGMRGNGAFRPLCGGVVVNILPWAGTMERAADAPKDRNDTFNEVIPFERVCGLLNRPAARHHAPAVTIVPDYTEKQRRPFVQRECRPDFARLLKKEKIYLL